MNVKENQQYQQTHQRIMAVMMGLLRQKTLKQITVAEVCRAAHINRSTFYEHFLDTRDVMEKIERGISKELREALERDGVRAPEDVFLSFFRHIEGHQDFYAVYLEQGLAMSVWGVLELRLREFPRKAPPRGAASPIQFEYAAEYRLAGLKALIFHWLKRNCREAPEELYDMFEKLSLPAAWEDAG